MIDNTFFWKWNPTYLWLYVYNKSIQKNSKLWYKEKRSNAIPQSDKDNERGVNKKEFLALSLLFLV